jgi:hypothetical protein
MTLQQQVHAALNRLTKWRQVFAGWQLGTRNGDDPECRAVRDHREVTILLRAELSALVCALVAKGYLTKDEYSAALLEEAEQLNKDYESRFPGMTATDIGIKYDQRAVETMKGWRP